MKEKYDLWDSDTSRKPFNVIIKSDVIFFNNCLNQHSKNFFLHHNDTNIIVYDMNGEMKYI